MLGWLWGREWLDDDWWTFMAIYFLYRTTGPKSGPPDLLQGQDDDRCLGHDATEEAPGATQAPREGQSLVTRLLLTRQKERTRAQIALPFERHNDAWRSKSGSSARSNGFGKEIGNLKHKREET